MFDISVKLILILVQSQLIFSVKYRALTVLEIGDDYRYPVCIKKGFVGVGVGFGNLIYYLDNMPLGYDYAFVKFCPISDQGMTLATKLGNDRIQVQSCMVGNKKNKTCEKPLRPILQESSTNLSPLNCKLYTFGYRLCKWERKQEWNSTEEVFESGETKLRKVMLPSYQVCYSQEAKTTSYVRYEMISAHLLEEDYLEKEQKIDPDTSLETDTFGYGFETDFDEKIKFFENNEEVTAMKLVPPEDFAIAEWGIAVFHQINVQAMYNEFVKTWNYIRWKIRLRIKYSLENVVIYAGTSSEQPIPKSWWLAITAKIEGREKGFYVILHNVTSNDEIEKRLCGTPRRNNVCGTLKWRFEIPKDLKPFIFCCKPNEVLFKTPVSKKISPLLGTDRSIESPDGTLSKKNCEKRTLMSYVPNELIQTTLLLMPRSPKRRN